MSRGISLPTLASILVQTENWLKFISSTRQFTLTVSPFFMPLQQGMQITVQFICLVINLSALPNNHTIRSRRNVTLKRNVLV